MKRKKRLCGILLVIAALIIMQLPVSEADAATSASDFKMEGSTLVKYRGTETNVSIPDTVERIGEGAFEDKNKVELIVVPNSVKMIDPYAFWGCDNLDTVVLGKGLTEIGSFTFANCKGLKQMTIPQGVHSIGAQAFADCVNMTDITIPPEVTDIHDTAFDGCYKLVIHYEAGSAADKYAQEFYEKQKEMPEYEDVSDYQPDSTTDSNGQSGTDSNDNSGGNQNTGDGAEGNGNSVQNDWDNSGTLLGSTSVVGNQAVVFIDNTSPNVQGSAAIGNNTMNGEASGEGSVIDNTDVLRKYTIVDGRVVADQAYYRNSTLQNVQLPAGITEIGQFSFARSSVNQILIPESTMDIDYGAFYHCDSLTNVNLPSTLQNVEPKAFVHTAWVDDFMAGNGGDGDFLISGGTVVAYRGSSSQVKIPEGVTLIAGEVFQNHTEIESITLPDTLMSIGEGAFEGCSNLSAVSFGKNLTTIKDRAFAGCSIVQVDLPASVNKLGVLAFGEKTAVNYNGSVPTETHEISAERLSNEAYRNPTPDNGQPGVQVVGMEHASAQLEGAARAYTLSIAETEQRSSLEKAFLRASGTAAPSDLKVYELKLSDNSGIPITKFGKQVLTVTMPVPENFADEGIKVVTMDRNGQLESAAAERIKVDGMDCIRFRTNHLSLYGLYGDGSSLDTNAILEETTVITSMSAPPDKQSGQTRVSSIRYQWVLGSILLVLGTFSIFWKSRTRA